MGESNDQVPTLSIGEVARHAGRGASSIRYYESIGLLPEPERIAGQRRYGPEVLRLLDVIDAAQWAGLSLDDIRHLLAASRSRTPVGDELRVLAERKLPDLDALIEHAEAARRWLQAASACECPTLDACALLNASAASDCP